jgi:hypothetical protein
VVETLRPLTVGELLDRTFTYYRRRFVLFVGIAAIPSLITLLYQLSRLIGPLAGGGVLLSFFLGLISILVSVIAAALVHGATVIAVSQLQLDQDVDIAQAFTEIKPRVGQLFLLGLNGGIRVILGFLLFIVPGVILALSYSIAVPVAVLEDLHPSDALSRSAELTKGSRGRILLIYCLFFVLSLIGGLIWPLLAGAIAATLSIPMRSGPTQLAAWAQVVVLFGGFVTQSVLGPISTIALTLVYYDVRVRKEAFDLQHMMEHLDAAAPQTPHVT